MTIHHNTALAHLSFPLQGMLGPSRNTTLGGWVYCIKGPCLVGQAEKRLHRRFLTEYNVFARSFVSPFPWCYA